MIPSHIVAASIVSLPMKLSRSYKCMAIKLAAWKKAFLSGEHLDFQWSFETRKEQES